MALRMRRSVCVCCTCLRATTSAFLSTFMAKSVPLLSLRTRETLPKEPRPMTLIVEKSDTPICSRRGKREEGRGKREEGRWKREEGRGKREETETWVEWDANKKRTSATHMAVW
jgi:hypothetical protein